MSGAIIPPNRCASRPKVYWVLLALQTVGAVIVLGNGVPFYRQLVSDFENHQPLTGIIWWAVASGLVMQIAYWLRVWLQPPLPTSGYVVLGHLTAFVARLSFILASSTFSVVFFLRFEQLSLPPHRVFLMLVVLFSLFCWSLELERLAKALQATKGNP
ncbi:MAG: hypothetical protein AAB370_00095 [Verrucomicrobiota bacterium]